MTVNGTTYSFTTAPVFVQYAVRLITNRWGSDVSTAPVFVQYQARLLATRWGV